MKVTALAGGVGGAKLLVGLDRALPGDAELTAIVNTGDDALVYGVHVSPDVDIVTYWLAGLADVGRGWGLAGDTFTVVDALERLGAPTWFRLGDRDLATCLYRSERLRAGDTLTSATDHLRRALGVRARILPMSDDPVRTLVTTEDGRELEFQEYFVKERQEPEVREVRFAGLEDAKPGPDVTDAISSADHVIICPSNPVVSIRPITSLPGVTEALREHPLVTAVTPIVQGRPLKGPADRLLAAEGVAVSAAGVAGLYRGIVRRFVVDRLEGPEEAEAVEALGLEPLTLDTVMSDHDRAEALARSLL